MRIQVICFLGLISFSACFEESPIIESPQEEITEVEEGYLDVDSRLWIYFENFEKEAFKRGFNIDLNVLGITGVISEISENGVAGTCQYGEHIHHVTVDKSFWDNSSIGFREFVIFHELGHCVLGRGHDESSFSNGICRSIMRSGTGTCRDAYINEYKDYYIDELFENSDVNVL